MFYTIPDSLKTEIDELESKIQQFQNGRLEAAALKVHRVPFGVYEQRKDNTYMVRIRCAGGAMTPAQLRLVAELSQRHGADTLHITTRQELQIHDVELDKVVPIMRQLLPAGLSTRGGGGNTVRNITASVDSGVAADEVFDVSPYAFALTSRLVSEPDSWLLPRKYKIAFSNSSRDTARAAFNDLGFIARTRNGVKGFEVYVAGGMGTKPQAGHRLHEFVADSEVYLIAEAVKRIFNQHGNRKNRHAARLRFLWNRLGEAGFLGTLSAGDRHPAPGKGSSTFVARNTGAAATAEYRPGLRLLCGIRIMAQAVCHRPEAARLVFRSDSRLSWQSDQ